MCYGGTSPVSQKLYIGDHRGAWLSRLHMHSKHHKEVLSVWLFFFFSQLDGISINFIKSDFSIPPWSVYHLNCQFFRTVYLCTAATT